MNIEHGAEGRFSAQHGSCEQAAWPHGHTFRVQVWATGDLNAVTGALRGTETLATSLAEYLASLQHQDLDRIMAGAVTTPVGLAATITGSLQARFPRITEVIVTDILTSESGRVQRTPRVL